LEVAGTKEKVFLEHEDLLNGPGHTPLRLASVQEEGHLFIYAQPLLPSHERIPV
jgi:hypothetical protein